MEIIKGGKPGVEICEVLGINPNLTESIEITFSPGDIVQAVATMTVTGRITDEIVLILKGAVENNREE